MSNRISDDETNEVALAPVQIETKGWKSPVVVTRLSLYIYSGAIALCFVLVILFGVWYLLDRRDTAAQHAQEQQAEIQQLQQVTNDLNAVKNPTPEQFKLRVKEALQSCLNDPDCKKLLNFDGGTP
jgi:hypothetical protein